MMMKDDPVIDRIRQVRRRISEKYDHDPNKLVMHYIELEKRHPERFVNLEQIRKEQNEAS
jgi:hypothetical protein